MFYVVLKEEKVKWYSGNISFPLTNDDIRIMYEEVYKEPIGDSTILEVDDSEIANKIMNNKAAYNEDDGWTFVPHEVDINFQ
jgi:hypothetical protein